MKAKVIAYVTKNSIREDYMVVSLVAVCQELIVWFLFVFGGGGVCFGLVFFSVVWFSMTRYF